MNLIKLINISNFLLTKVIGPRVRKNEDLLSPFENLNKTFEKEETPILQMSNSGSKSKLKILKKLGYDIWADCKRNIIENDETEEAKEGIKEIPIKVDEQRMSLAPSQINKFEFWNNKHQKNNSCSELGRIFE